MQATDPISLTDASVPPIPSTEKTDPTTAPPRRRAKLDSIQIFRGWAALLVVLSHASTFSRSVFHQPLLGGVFDFGNAGVDFFFVLSGFIIFFVHRDDLGVPERLRPFAIKRFVRIYPIYWVACLLLIPLFFLAGQPLARDPVAVLTSVLLIPQDHWPVVSVAWTLTHEMLFYILFGLLIWKLRQVLWPVVLWMAGCVICYGILLASPADARAIDTILPFPWKWLFHPHNLEFLLGCAAGHWVLRVRPEKMRGWLWVGAAAFALCAAFDQPGTAWNPAATLGQPLTYGLASMLLVVGACARDFTGSKLALPGYRVWHYLGDASYSIYLFHGIALSLTVRLARKLVDAHLVTPSLAMLGVVVLSVAVGAAAHSLLEKPLLAFLRRRIFGPAPAATHA
jgi:exopolysaccharide production protein ExoZ